MSNRAIAELQNVSVRAIEVRRASIYEKLEVKSTVALLKALKTFHSLQSS